MLILIDGKEYDVPIEVAEEIQRMRLKIAEFLSFPTKKNELN